MESIKIYRYVFFALCFSAVIIVPLRFSPPVAGRSQSASMKPDIHRVLQRHETFKLDPANAVQQVRQTGRLALHTSTETLEIVLAPHDLRADSHRAVSVDDGGRVTVLERDTVRTFKGYVEGVEESVARFTIDGEKVEGLIVRGGERYFVEPAARYASVATAADDFVFYRATDVLPAATGSCESTVAARFESEAARFGSSMPARLTDAAAPFSPAREIELITEADFEFFQAFSSNANVANSEILSIINMIDGVYQSELGLTFRVVFQRVWETPNDPYSATGVVALLTELRTNYNAAPPAGAPARDLVHMWTGKSLDGPGFAFGGREGIANDGVVCRNPSAPASYGVSQMFSSVPAKFIIPAHEMGHNLGASHPDREATPRPECGTSIMNSDATFSNLSLCQFSRDQITNYVNAFGGCLAVATTPPPTVQFSQQSFRTSETTRTVSINLTRSSGSGSTTVSYETSNGSASDRSDYNAAFGSVSFAPGETSKSFTIFITDDSFLEPVENFNVTLTNATGATLGTPSAATVEIDSNDPIDGPNPIKEGSFDSDFFVRRTYIDFLNRDADAAGLGFWKNQIDECTAQACREIRQINTSAAFFLSIEFQQTGYFVYRVYQASFGRRVAGIVPVTLREFVPDTQQIGRGVVIGAPGSEQILEANTQTYIDQFVARPQFTAAYPSALTPAQFVDALNVNTGGALSPAERNDLVNRLGAGQLTRAQVLRGVAQDAEFTQNEFNRAFVLMQYFGYLRRNPNDAPDADFGGFNFWLGKLNEFNGNFVNAEMVKAFINSSEYQGRFGP